MGWADAILGSSNPFAKYVDSNPYVTSAIGAGLASGQNLSSGLANAVQAIPQARSAQNAYDMTLKDQQTRLDQINYERAVGARSFGLQQQQWANDAKVASDYGLPDSVVQAVASGTPLSTFTTAVQNGPDGTTYPWGKPQLPGSSQAPVSDAVTSADLPPLLSPPVAPSAMTAPPVPLAAAPQSSVAPVQTAQAALSGPPSPPSTAPSWLIQTPTGTMVDQAAKARAIANATQTGTDQATAAASVPKLQELANNAKQFGDQLLNDKAGLDQTFGYYGPNVDGIGIPQQMLPFPAQPGTPKANFAKNLDSLKGIMASEGIKQMAQSGLRLTQQEVMSAKDALATISTATDQATFEKGVRQFQAVTQRALQEAKAIAAGKYDPTADNGGLPTIAPVSTQAPSGTTQGGLPWQVLQ